MGGRDWPCLARTSVPPRFRNGEADVLSILARTGWSRRELLRIGTLGLFEIGRPQLLKGRARFPDSMKRPRRLVDHGDPILGLFG